MKNVYLVHPIPIISTCPCPDIWSAQCLGPALQMLRLVSPEGSVQEYNSSRGKMKTVKAVLEGCGCYRLYSRHHSRGSSFYVSKRGKQYVPLRVVRSVERVQCSQGTRERKQKKIHNQSLSPMIKKIQRSLAVEGDQNKALEDKIAQLVLVNQNLKYRLDVMDNVITKERGSN